MKINNFIKSTLILLIGGLMTKLLGMIIKIIMTRLIGTEGIGIYMLINPTMMLLITIASLGLPVAISTLVATDKYNNKSLLFSSLFVVIILNIIMMILIMMGAKYIGTTLLNEKRCVLGLKAISFILPFISISNILRGYYFGTQRMGIHVITNIVEDIVRIILLLIGIPIYLMKGIEYAVAFIVITNIFSELSSILLFIFFLPKDLTITKKDIIPNISNIKSIFKISLPATGSRLIGNFGAFLEPIILTSMLLKQGFSNHYIVTEYGILNGYVMPLLLMPSFFTLAISQAIIPVVSKAYAKKNYKEVKRKVVQAIIFSLIIGIPITIIFETIPEFLLKFIYNTNEGISYLKLLAPFFLILYIQSPIIACIHAMNKSLIALKGTLIGTIIKILLLTFLTSLKIGFYGFICSLIFNIIFVTVYQSYHLVRIIKKKI